MMTGTTIPEARSPGFAKNRLFEFEKAALSMLVVEMAAELGPSSIRVNAVSPGAIRGDRREHHLGATGTARQTLGLTRGRRPSRRVPALR